MAAAGAGPQERPPSRDQADLGGLQPAPDVAKGAFLAAVAAIDPARLVKAAVREGLLDDWFGDRLDPRPIHVIAVGKAAPRMVWGLVEANVPFSGIGAAPAGVPMPQLERFQWHKGEHPVPGPGSFAAGRAVLEWAQRLPEQAHVLALVSGGGSACMEATDDEAALAAQWRALLQEAMSIGQINARRSARSHLKGGRLGRLLARRCQVRAWVVSDTPEGAPTVASAPFFDPERPERIPHRVLADAGTAVAGAGQALADAGWAPYRFPRRLDGPVRQEVDAFLSMASSLPAGSALVGAGEALLAVGPDAPPGGRCQHAALQAALWLRDRAAPLAFFAGATDGIDGSTREAGAWATAGDAAGGAAEALVARDAHAFLSARGRTFRTGATGTNANDVWIALQDPSPL